MYIKVRAHPASKRESVEQKGETQFEIWVKEKAERNMANRRICQIVAEKLGVLPRDVRIISGHQSPSKMLSVEK